MLEMQEKKYRSDSLEYTETAEHFLDLSKQILCLLSNLKGASEQESEFIMPNLP